jgi:hypothetical protein
MKWIIFLQDTGLLALVAVGSIWLARELVKHYLKHDIAEFIGNMARDYAAQLQESENRFTVAAMSHMANVAFDKHAAFCEEYMAEVDGTMGVLFRGGPLNATVLENATTLRDIRAKYSVWLTPEIEEKLMGFETALSELGADAWLVKALERGDEEERQKAGNEAFMSFAKVMGFKHWKGQALSGVKASVTVVEGLREVLGIADLTRLRAEVVRRAMAEAAKLATGA